MVVIVVGGGVAAVCWSIKLRIESCARAKKKKPLHHYLFSFRHAATVHGILHSRIFVFRFTETDWNVFMLVHVHNLSSHGHEEEHKEVHQEDWPENWNVKDGEECHYKACASSLCAGEPELEFW